MATPAPGTSTNRDTLRALVNAVSAARALTRCPCVSLPSVPTRSPATEMATNRSPISVPATSAVAVKSS